MDPFWDQTFSRTKVERLRKYFPRISTLQIPSRMMDAARVMVRQRECFDELASDPAAPQDLEDVLCHRYVVELWLSELQPALSENDTSELLAFVPRDEDGFKEHLTKMNADHYGKETEWWTIAMNLYTASKMLHHKGQAVVIKSDTLQSLNRVLMENITADNGNYRRTDASPRGYNLTYSRPADIAVLLKELCTATTDAFDAVDKEEDPATRLFHAVMIAALFFSHFLFIHPFSDGNGRTARLALSWMLKPFTSVPVSLYLTHDSRTHYLEALFAHHSNLEEYPAHVLKLIWECTAASANQAIGYASPLPDEIDTSNPAA